MFRYAASIISLVLALGLACSQADQSVKKDQESRAETSTFSDSVESAGPPLKSEIKPKITFIELGSVTCIPCKKMQPVMKSIEGKYGNQVEVVFHDVWKDPEPGDKYGVKVIPTQVFLDADGKELMRHVGFFPESEIDAFLQKQGLTPINPTTKDAL
ncbi:MAG: hypothetical protein B6244_01990 [Candidatus Cloacimonetes bacterium 4572_55]|nr:MAG: hypothetical protein B6244_01990 [Candidatus Cloacimonetes bacterium 4572_55]